MRADEVKPRHSKLVHEVPTTWHQMCVFFIASTDEEDKEFKVHSPLIFGASALIVFFQCAAVCAILTSTVLPSCTNNYQCEQAQDQGTFCEVSRFASRCQYCGEAPVDTENAQNATIMRELCDNPGGNLAKLELGRNYPKDSVEMWCSGCVDPMTGKANPLKQVNVMTGNVKAMNWFDWLTLVCTVVVFSLHIVAELKGIELCNIAIRHAEEAKERDGSRDLGEYSVPLQIINGIRRWMFLPTLAASIPMMVAFKGGDALSVCMNTVAIVFLTEVDDVMFNYGIGERVRERAKVAGRVPLAKNEEEKLSRTKGVHVFLVTVSVIGGVIHMGYDESGYLFGMTFQFFAFWVAGTLEGLIDVDDSLCQKASHCIKTAFYCFCGFWLFDHLIEKSGHTIVDYINE